MYFTNGPSLSLDEQLHRGGKYETFHIVFGVYVELQCDGIGALGLELFLLCHTAMHVYGIVGSIVEDYIVFEYGGVIVYQ